MVDATKDWEAYFRGVIEHVELGKRRVLEQFAQSLDDWLDDLLNHPIPDTWPQELARFVAHTAYYGLDIPPHSIRALAELIRARKEGAGRVAAASKSVLAATHTSAMAVAMLAHTPTNQTRTASSTQSAEANEPKPVFVNGVEVAGPGPLVTASFAAKVQQVLEFLDSRIAKWWKGNSIQGQIRARNAKGWATFWRWNYRSYVENKQPFIVVDQSFTADQTAEAIISEVNGGWFAESIGTFYRSHHITKSLDERAFQAWRGSSVAEAGRQAGLLAELYYSGIATLSGTDIILDANRFLEEGPHWDQLLTLIPLVPAAAIVIKTAAGTLRVPKHLLEKLQRLSAKERKALIARASDAKTQSEALDIIEDGLNSSKPKRAARTAAKSAGPGKWVKWYEDMSDQARAYQTQITGHEGEYYLVDGTKFDGFSEGVLLEAKGPSYSRFIQGDDFKIWFQKKNEILNQARTQSQKAAGAPIIWHVAEPELVATLENLFELHGITGIRVLHTPAK